MNSEQTEQVATRRQKLQESIDEFNNSTKLYLPTSLSLPTPTGSEWADIDHDDTDDSDNPDKNSDPTSKASSAATDTDRYVQPEHQQILLPSSFGPAACKGVLAPFSNLQLLLCKGQANDILQALRLLIGKQSFHYRKKIRKGVINSNYNMRTRSHKEANENAKAIKLLARIYRCIRQSMLTLGASEDDKAKYQQLTKEDIKSSTAVVDFNAAGQRNKSLSWIWHTHKSSTEDPSWLRERMSSIRHIPFHDSLYPSFSLQGQLAPRKIKT